MDEVKPSKEKVAEFETGLLNFLLGKVKQGEITFENFQDISSDILHYGQNIEVEGQFAVIVHALTEKWPVFKTYQHNYN